MSDDSPDSPEIRSRNRLIIGWVMFTALWISAMLIATAWTRPAPSFYVMAPLTLGGPLAALLVMLVLRRLRKRP